MRVRTAGRRPNSQPGRLRYDSGKPVASVQPRRRALQTADSVNLQSRRHLKTKVFYLIRTRYKRRGPPARNSLKLNCKPDPLKFVSVRQPVPEKSLLYSSE